MNLLKLGDEAHGDAPAIARLLDAHGEGKSTPSATRVHERGTGPFTLVRQPAVFVGEGEAAVAAGPIEGQEV